MSLLLQRRSLGLAHHKSIGINFRLWLMRWRHEPRLFLWRWHDDLLNLLRGFQWVCLDTFLLAYLRRICVGAGRLSLFRGRAPLHAEVTSRDQTCQVNARNI